MAQDSTKRKILFACPHGFCTGVSRAIRLAGSALGKHGPPVYCLNEIVHNSRVVEDMKKRGMIFVKAVAEVPAGSVLLFSAHGVSPAIRQQGEDRNLQVIDATCPFVTKVHREVKRFAELGHSVLLIGHEGHEEIQGVAGEAPDTVTVIQTMDDARTVEVADPTKVGVATQTTLSFRDITCMIDELKQRFPALVVPDKQDICYATENRQKAIELVAGLADLVIVLGSRNSSNSNRLVEVARASGCKAMLVDGVDDLAGIPPETTILGLSAGASTPSSAVDEAIAQLAKMGFGTVERMGKGE